MSGFLDDLNEHRGAREQRLRSKDGWLSLVERVVLEEGANTLENGAVASLERGTVTLRVDGKEHVWGANEKGPGPFFFVGERRYEILRQATKTAIRVRDPNSASLAKFRGVDFFAPDEKYRVTAKIVGPERTITLAVGLGVDVDHRCPGTLHFAIDGRALTIDPVIDDDVPDKLFLLFKDPTNTKTTYGAGRFLYAALPDKDGVVVVDFNRCFNPPCALTEFASCPIAPSQNRLPIAIEAGEKYPLR